MTPRPSRLWWLSGLAVAALTLNAQPSPSSTTPSPSAETAPAPLTTTPRLVVVGNPNDPWEGPIDAPTLPLKLLLPIVERLTGRIALPSQGLNNPDLPIVFKATPTRGELLQAIETVLTMNQLALVPLGPKFLKVVPLTNARIEAPALIEGSTLDLPPSGQIAAKLFQLQFLRASEFLPLVGPLLNPNATGGAPVLFDKANAVLVTDSISTLQRIEQIIAKTDAPNAAGIQTKFYTLTNGAKASDIVTQLRNFLQPLQTQMGAGTSYHADDRTNQIIIFSDPRQLPLFDELITKLDVKSDPNTRNEVIPLKHADAAELATLLNSLITGQSRASQASGNNATRRNPGQNPATRTTPDAPVAPSPNIPAGPLVDVGAPSQEFSSLINLQPDVRSNAIVASGTLDDMRLIKALIEKIDVILPQVRIEVVIAEVTLSDSASTGISSLGLNVQNGKLVGFNARAPGIAVGGAESAEGGLSAFALFNENRDLSGIIQLSATPRKNNNSILSQPSISVMHNKEGIVFIGETRPVISGSTTNPTSSSTNGFSTSSTVTQQEIGTKVTVKPLIGYDGTVQMEIKQDITDVAGTVIVDGNDQYIISKRTTESFITAKSGEILVLSGMQKRANNKTTNRLGPIPIIGDLLGSRSRREDRTELVLFLRPTVLTGTPADNVQAMRQIELMPNRDAVKKTLSPVGTINDDKIPPKDGPVLNRKK